MMHLDKTQTRIPCEYTDIFNKRECYARGSVPLPTVHEDKMLTSTLLTVLGALLIPVANAQLSQISPSGNYTPSRTACPSNHTFIRPAQEGLSVGEAKWRKTRLTQVLPALEAYLTKQAFPDFCTDLYIEALKNNTDAIPKLALAISGGGTRSEIIGLGVYNALDGRNNQSVAAGTGGLTQALTYVAGCEWPNLGNWLT